MVAGAAFIPNTASILVLRRRAARAGKEGDSEEEALAKKRLAEGRLYRGI
jgi:hypothetical protein